jgi:hypothetical protein
VSRPALAVHADLTLAHGSGAIRIRSGGGPIDVDIPVKLWRARPSRRVRRRWLGRLDRSLAAGGLTARVRVLGLTVLRLGVDRRITVLGRALGLTPEIRS